MIPIGSNVPVIVGAAIVLGAFPAGPPVMMTQDGGFIGALVAHPATGEYVIPLLQPVDPSVIQVIITGLSTTLKSTIDTSNASNPVNPSVSVYLTAA